MQRGGQSRRLHHRSSAARLDEVHLIKPSDLIGDANSLIELNQVRAEAKQNVLTVVDDFTGAGMFVRGSASTQERPLLEQRDAEPVVRKSAGCGKSGETTSGDCDCGRG